MPGGGQQARTLFHCLYPKVRMTISFAAKAIAACALLTLASAAFSHVSLSEPSAPAGSTYRAALRVGHGCGESPTTAIQVILPPGFQGAKPMPKAGWRLSIKTAKLDQPYDRYGKRVTEDVSEITWTAVSPEYWLPNAHYDEFVLRGGLPGTLGPLWFKVLQTCEKGVNDWSEVPASGTLIQGLKTPAALLEVLEAAPKAHQH